MKTPRMNRAAALMIGAATALALIACSAPAATPGGSTAATPATSPSASASASPSESASASPSEAAAASTGAGTPVTITAGDQVFTATLNDSAAAQDFAATFPLTIPAARVGTIEFMVELPAPLTETGPFYTTVEAGDIVYWNPRDSVTVIYKPTSSVSELTKIGEVTSDLGTFEALPDDVEMRFEIAG
jgi:hypothetical protein